MDDSAIAIALEPLILKAINGSDADRTELAEDSLMQQLVKRVSKRVAWQYNENKDDVMQELWLAVWVKIHTIEQPRFLATWLYATANHFCLNKKRHSGHETSYCKRIKSLDVEEFVDIEEYLVKQERLERIQKVTSQFPPEVVNGWIEEKTLKEISLEMDVSIPTVSRIRRAMFEAIAREFGATLPKKVK